MLGSKNAFTLLELIFSIFISSILFSTIFLFYKDFNNINHNQETMFSMYANMRAAFCIMENQIQNYKVLKAGCSSITIGHDFNNDQDLADKNETISFGFAKKYDKNQDGISDIIYGAQIGRSTGHGFYAVADNIYAISFAYAFWQDGKIKTSENANIVWACDSDEDGFLDLYLDANDDGVIDNKDSPKVLNPKVSVDKIKAVKVFILGVACLKNKEKKEMTYVLGNKKITTDDSYYREPLSLTISLLKLLE